MLRRAEDPTPLLGGSVFRRYLCDLRTPGGRFRVL